MSPEHAATRSDHGGTTPLPYAWLVTAVLLLVYVVSFVDRAIMNLLVGSIRRDLGISDTEMSLLIGLAFAILYLGMSIPLGLLADRYSRVRLVAAACLVWSLATTASGFAQSYWSLFACRVVVGFGEAALIPAAYALLADYFPRHRLAQALSVFSAGAWVGIGSALIVGGAVMQQVRDVGLIELPWLGARTDWQMAFLIVGPPGLVIAALVLFIREPARGTFSAGMAPIQRPIGVSLADTLRFTLAHRAFFLSHLLGFGLFSILAQATIAWAPMVLVRTHAVSPAEVGLKLGVLYLTFSVAGIVIAGALSDRLFRHGRRDAPMQIGAVGVFMLGVSIVTFSLAPSFELALVVAAAMTFFVSFPLGVAATAIQYVTPPSMRGQISALYLLVTGGLGMGLGPTIVAALTDFVFHDDQRVGSGLAITALACGTIGPLLLLRGRRPMRDMLSAQMAASIR